MSDGLVPGRFAALVGIALLLIVLVLAGLVLAAALKMIRARRTLYERLRPLSPARRAEVLLPLQGDEEAETRRFAALLARDMSSEAAERAPAGEVDGRGGEVSTEPYGTHRSASQADPPARWRPDRLSRQAERRRAKTGRNTVLFDSMQRPRSRLSWRGRPLPRRGRPQAGTSAGAAQEH